MVVEPRHAATPFEQFFDTEFQQELAAVVIPAEDQARVVPEAQPSWDRRAAYIIWNLKGRPGDTW